MSADGPTDGLPDKLYFRIGEVAEVIGVEPHVLRYWEREFRTIRPAKSRRGQRVYSRRDVETLARIRALLYDEGFTIAGAKRKLATHRAQTAAKADEGPVEGQVVAPQDKGQAPDAVAREGIASEAQRPPERAAMPRFARERLVALRDEITAFLTELEPRP